MPIFRLEIENKPAVPDALATKTAQTLSAWLGLSPARIRTRKVYLCDLDISEAEAKEVLAAIADPVIEVAALGALPDGDASDPPEILTVSFLPGVTDAVGKSVKTACEDALGRALTGQVYTGTMYLVWGLARADVERAAAEVLHNPLIQRIRIEEPPRRPDLTVPRAGATSAPRTEIVPLRGLSDEAARKALARAAPRALDPRDARDARPFRGGGARADRRRARVHRADVERALQAQDLRRADRLHRSRRRARGDRARAASRRTSRGATEDVARPGASAGHRRRTRRFPGLGVPRQRRRRALHGRRPPRLQGRDAQLARRRSTPTAAR